MNAPRPRRPLDELVAVAVGTDGTGTHPSSSRSAIRDTIPVSHRARHAPDAVVLEAAANTERHTVVHVHFIELPNGHVAAEIPRLTAIPREGHATVATDDQVARVGRVYPERVVLTMDVAEQFGEGPAAVVREIEAAIRA